MDKTLIQRAYGKANLVKEAGEAIDDESEFVTLPKLARLVTGRTGIKESCALEVLETAFSIVDERGLIFDLGMEVYDDEE